MASLGEIEDAVATPRVARVRPDVCLLQCASLYPSPAHIMNLRAIPTMAAAFDVPVGLSDHTLGHPRGRRPRSRSVRSLLEKHFTLDRTRSGPDHPFAIEPDELKELVAHVRDVEAAMGDGVKRGPSDEERVEMYAEGAPIGGGRVRDPRGAPASRATCSRSSGPGHGIAPKLIEALVGRVAAVDIDDDEVLTWEML